MNTSLKFSDDIEKKIYSALLVDSSRYGKMMKDFFEETVKGNLEMNLGDISKGETALEELRTKIPRSRLSEMTVKEPAL